MKLVLGLGISGKASASFLVNKGHRVVAYDDDPKACAGVQGVEFHEKGNSFDWNACEQVVVSPGVPPTHPLYQGAVERGIEVVGEIELALRHLKHRPMVGITGTNGKTTVTLLISHLLNAAGKKSRAVGNIGTPLIEEVEHADQEAILSIELSSFQLERVETKALDGGVILNVTPDHNDRYPQMADYAKAKGRLAHILKKEGLFLLNPAIKPLVPELFTGNHQLLPNENREAENISAAISLVKLFGLTDSQIEKGLATFKKPPHRIEFIRDLKGIFYYSDSKSTNLDSTIHALLTVEKNILLIAGGVDKGFSFAPWKEYFANRVKALFLIGQAAHRIEQELKNSVPIYQCGTLREALLLSTTLGTSGDNILLSPGCSSYDQFKNYHDRGEQFRQLVIDL